MFRKLTVLLVIISLFFIINANDIYASNEEILNLQEENQSIDIDNDGIIDEIKIDKSRNMIYINEEVIEIDGYIYKVYLADLTNDDEQEIIIALKSGGTSSILSYKAYKFISGSLRVLFERDNIYKGTLNIINNKIIEKIPAYSNDDFNFSTNYYILNEYVFEENEFILSESRLEEISDVKMQLYGSRYTNPSREEIKSVIEEVAEEKGIPSIILKSIAYTESNLMQFKNGRPLLSFDGLSWGIMQVTPSAHPQYDVEKLKYDIRYNINAGAEILLDKWNYAFAKRPVIPKIGDGDPRVLENWYFTIWAYNGWSESNNPNMLPYDHGSWVQRKAYQDKVLDYALSEFDQRITKIKKRVLPEAGLPLKYGKYATPQPKHFDKFREYKAGDIVINTSNIILRDERWNKIEILSKGTGMMILEGPVLYNGYLRYNVKPIKDNGQTKLGWVSLNWIKYMNNSDLNDDNTTDIRDVDMISEEVEAIDHQEIFKWDMNYDNIIDSYDVLLVKEKSEHLNNTILGETTNIYNDKTFYISLNRDAEVYVNIVDREGDVIEEQPLQKSENKQVVVELGKADNELSKGIYDLQLFDENKKLIKTIPFVFSDKKAGEIVEIKRDKNGIVTAKFNISEKCVIYPIIKGKNKILKKINADIGQFTYSWYISQDNVDIEFVIKELIPEIYK